MGGGPSDQQDRLLVVLPMPEPKAELARLRERFPRLDVEFYQVGSLRAGEATGLADVPEDVYKDKNLLLTFTNLPKSLDDAPRLELLHLPSAGSNHIQKHPLYTDTDITITTSSGIHGPQSSYPHAPLHPTPVQKSSRSHLPPRLVQIAEWVLMTTLVRSHFYDQFHDAQKEHRWARYRSDQTVHDLVGQRLGVLGYGSIGRQVARVAKAMGMDVIAYTATPKDTPASRRDKGYIVPGTGDAEGALPSAWFSGLERAELHHFLAQDIDMLLVSVPLTPQTRHFLGAEELRVLRAGSSGSNGNGNSNGSASGNINRTKAPFLINISRGQIVQQSALVQALHDGTLGGAALDVTDPEPLPADDPLWSAPNVTITPHISGNGAAYLERSFAILRENLERRERGERLLNVVDRRRGY
ncbi:uncharacterized protein K452DRAFT_294233 [Aplosporella prunicola CBS 121167]|uniref:D-isomer specific 2-hydroxyacid dehydrogenase NAD-binding domain-containing protein n=1 Tax=Aplosporella prunicola CBS 121167 TaxID=1176127 RepID=A0A6A6BRN0_9PEZI|nr:uncharacterized protein K452DRAFT_294233 [Aplosporella prunicola CBS 121167]KAF2146680.1 hypothetical protein K452DRAFT_294233 [Aplosporella prunicola CBS 121167]